MQPYVNNYPNPIGDIAIVSKYQTVKRGDVVIIDMTGSKNTANDVNKKSLIKRVIAVGGDKLRIVVENGVVAVYVNDIKLNEPYIKDVYNQSIQKTEYFQNQTGWADWMDEYGNSTLPPLDSDGTIIIPSGYFFFMGDNRADSFDCRSMGPMPMSYIDGVVEEILDINNFWNKLITFLF